MQFAAKRKLELDLNVHGKIFYKKISRLCREQVDAFPAKWSRQNSAVNWGKAAMSTTILSYILARDRRPTVLVSVTHRAVSLFRINNLDHWEYILFGLFISDCCCSAWDAMGQSETRDSTHGLNRDIVV